MHSHRISPRVLLSLIAIAVLTPIAICLAVAMGRLLAAMGDAASAAVANWVSGVLGAFWVFDLICLVLVLAIHSLLGADDRDGLE